LPDPESGPTWLNALRTASPDGGRRLQPNASIFDGETLPDFIDPSVQRIEPGVERLVVKIKNIAAGQQPENPVVALYVVEDLLDRMANGNNNSQQDIHRILRLEK
jgi:hypothetical protein